MKDERGMVFPVLVLIGIGLVMVYSSSVFISISKYGSSVHYFWRHIINLFIGCITFLLVSRFDYRKLRGMVIPLLVCSFILLVLVFIPGIGMSAGEKSEVRRWINLRIFTFQPAELVKISMVIFLADYISRAGHAIVHFYRGVVIPLAVTIAFQVMILLQPDFGTVMSIGILSVTLLFVGGLRLKYVLGIIGVFVPIIAVLIVTARYRLTRLLCFIDPWEDARGCGYQLVQSFLALGRGGLTGVGIGDSKQKLFFLPEAHNDFIFSLMGEEAGFLGAVTVLCIFLYLLIRLFRMAMHIEDPFGYYLAIGLTLLIISQALINFAVTVGLMPTKGLPLPFISYGGSALLTHMAAFGLVMSVFRGGDTLPTRRALSCPEGKQVAVKYYRRYR